MKPSNSIATAIEVFAGGVCFARSSTRPYEVHRVGPLWVMRDGPRKRSQDYRREEWIAHGLIAPEVDLIVRRQTRGKFCVCAIRTAAEPAEPIRAAYKAAGYRLGATEAIMVHRLKSLPRVPEPFPIERVTTIEGAQRLRKATGRGQIRPADLADDAPIRRFVALDGPQPIGWAASITVGEFTWVQGMYVAPAYRRRGIGKAILTRLLREDRKYGSKASYLTASHAGAMLYPHVGYELIGELLLYTPRK